MTELEIANLAVSYFGGRPVVSMTISSASAQQDISLSKWFAPARDECLASHPWNFASKMHRAEVSWTALSGSAITNNGSGLIRVTSTSHGLATGERVSLQQAQGVTNANGSWYVTVINANSFDLQDSTFSGTYTSGTGEWVKVPLFDWSYQFSIPADCLSIRTVNGRNSNEQDSEPYEIQGALLLTNCDVIELRYTAQITTTTLWTQTFINAFSLLLASYVAQDLTGPAGRAADLRAQYETAISPKAKGRDARQGKRRASNPSYDSDVVRARRGFC